MYATNGLCTEAHKIFPMHGLWGGGSFKSFLTYLYCTQYKDINVCHSDIEKHNSCKKKKMR